MSAILRHWKLAGRDAGALEKFQAPDLKSECHRLNIKVGGVKNELIWRIDEKYAELFGRNESPPPASPASVDEEILEQQDAIAAKKPKTDPRSFFTKKSPKKVKLYETAIKKRLAWYLSGKAGSPEDDNSVKTKHNPKKSEFCCQFTLDQSPKINVKRQFQIQLPCDADQGRQLVLLAAEAPIGRGSETLMDKAIRDAWQIEGDQVEFMNSDGGWLNLFSDSRRSELLSKIHQQLAPKSQFISARFYKLLVYGEGSFFKPHMDTQREPHHFGSIVVFLPSFYSGGELIVQHGPEKKRFDFGLTAGKGEPEKLKCHAVAFFADCLHEVLPVKSGYRLTLTYNLFYEGTSAPELPLKTTLTTSEHVAHNLEKLFRLKAWQGKSAGLLLDHRYALASLSPSLLKGADRQAYDLLANSGRFDIELVPVKIQVTGLGWDDDAYQTAEGYYGELLMEDSDEGLHFVIERLSNKELAKLAAKPKTPQKKGGGALQRKKAGHHRGWSSYKYIGEGETDDDRAAKLASNPNLLSFFTYFPRGYDERLGNVMFLNDFRRVTVDDVVSSRANATGNTGTDFQLQYQKAAFIIRQKTAASRALNFGEPGTSASNFLLSPRPKVRAASSAASSSSKKQTAKDVGMASPRPASSISSFFGAKAGAYKRKLTTQDSTEDTETEDPKMSVDQSEEVDDCCMIID